MTVVTQRLILDCLNHCWGKWRPWAEAERLGPLAIRLDALRNRDGHSFDEACDILRTNYHVKMSRKELAELDARLPPRVPRRTEGEEALEHLSSESERADSRVLPNERTATLKTVKICLRKALATLSTEDWIILKMRILSGVSIADISRNLQLKQKPLYKRLKKIQEKIREALERDGVRAEEVSELLSSGEH